MLNRAATPPSSTSSPSSAQERYFLVIPVDEDMMRRREDVGGATLIQVHQTLPGLRPQDGGSRRDRVWYRDKAGAETSTPHCRA
jgi:hypothetical protein